MRRIAVLGPAEVFEGDRRVSIGGPLPRRLLTVLVAAEGRAVPDDRLAEAAWAGRRPPSNPAGALQVYVSRLRRTLPGLALERTAQGYRLAADTDISEFTALVDRARTAEPTAARAILERALGLWRGEAFADVTDDERVDAARAALTELREWAREERAAALLSAGDTTAAIAELEKLVRATPYRERRWSLLASALYRSARQAEALDAVRRARGLLAQELGVDPSPELRDVERRILRHDPDLLPRQEATPRPLSTFVGRAADLALLVRLTAAHRLVTIVGTAGAGKTRVALQHADSSVFVRLADVADPALLLPAFATALGVPHSTGDLLDAIARALRFRPDTTLIRDNCEHLGDHVGRLVLALLEHLPSLRIVATSRIPLGLDGERVMPLGPLTRDDAVALLIDRIRAVRPHWVPSETDHADLNRLAEALDDIPLALELAAARTRTFALRDLTARLDDRFALFGPVPQGAITPHATLQSAIAWSFGLLTAAEVAVVTSLWPFEGGFPLEGATDPAILAVLVDHSLITADTDAAPTRYRMLETIRAYCRAIDPAPDATRERHAAWIRGLVKAAARDLLDERSADAMRLLRLELPNIRAALVHDLTVNPAEALRTAGRLMWFWFRAGLLGEGRLALTSALEKTPDAPLEDRVRARVALSELLYVGGETQPAREILKEAAAALAGDPAHRALFAEVRYYQAIAQLPTGDGTLAMAAAMDAYEIARQTRLRWLIPSADMALGAALVLLGRRDEGRERLLVAARQAPSHGQIWVAALSELMLAQTMIAPEDGDPLPLLRSSLRRFREEDDLSSMLAVLHHGALVLGAAAANDGRAQTLRAVVHQHLVRHAIPPARTYITTVVPDGWYAGDPPAEALTLDEAVAALG